MIPAFSRFKNPLTCQSLISARAPANSSSASASRSPVCICKKSGVCACSISVSMERSKFVPSSTVSAISMADTAIKIVVAADSSLLRLISFHISVLRTPYFKIPVIPTSPLPVFSHLLLLQRSHTSDRIQQQRSHAKQNTGCHNHHCRTPSDSDLKPVCQMICRHPRCPIGYHVPYLR